MTSMPRSIGFRPCRMSVAFLSITFCLAGAGALAAADYYIDPAGNDGNAGTSSAAPWRSLDKVNGTVFQPGDKVLFKRGGTWVGTLHPQGSGTSSARIKLAAYGEGAKPWINGNGNWAVISLSTQDYWTIDGFDVSNPAGDTSNSRSGIRIDYSGGGTMRGIEILNNDVHDVSGIKNVNDGGRNNGGIFFWINEPGKADGVLIQGNTVKNIHGQGIAFNAEAEYVGGGMNYANCSPNVIARGNTVLTTSGDGILMLGTDNELAEYNEVGYAGQLSDWYNNIAAAWPTRHVNGVWQYNHVHHTAALNANDSTAFDNDGFVKGATVFQYNVSHDNAGGFIMEYTWGGDDPSAQTIARYNISWNESRILASNRNNARIYNNVFYNPGATIDVSWTPNPSYVLFSNNLFVAAGRTGDFSRQLFMNNNFSGGVTRPVTIDGNRTEDPLFVSPNTSGNLAGFILQSGSPARNSGYVIGGNGGKDIWGASVPSASSPHRGASQISSIASYTATPSYLRVTGADTVEVPATGTITSAYVPVVRDQNFLRIASPSVTWSVSPALAGVTVDANGTLSVAATAMPKRIAVQATCGSAVASYSVALFTNQPIHYTWGGGNGSWTDTSAAGWNGGPPAGSDHATINGGSVDVNVVGVGNLGSLTLGGGTLTVYNFTGGLNTYTAYINLFLQGGTLHGNGNYNNWGAGILKSPIVAGSSPSTISSSSFFNLNGTGSSSSVFDVANVTGDAAADLVVPARLADVSADQNWVPAALVKSGAGTMRLAAVNTYTGGTTVNGGTLELAGAAGGTGLLRGAITVNAGATLALTGGDGTGFGWQDQISSIAINGGTLTNPASCHVWNISGGIAMTGGTLQSNNGTSDPNGPQLEWNRTNVATLASADTATIAGRIRIRGDAGYPGLSMDVADGAAATDLLVSAAITEATGGLTLVKSGAGKMVVAGSNSHSGGTTVHGGTLVAETTGTLGSGNLTVNTGATCEIRNLSGAIANTASVSLNGTGKLTLANGVAESVNELWVNGVLQPMGTYTSASSFITGGGSLVVATGAPTGSGIWTSLANGNWSVPGNWQNGIVPDRADTSATFAQSTGVTVTLDGNRTIGGLVFANANYSLAGASTLTLDVATGTPTVDVASGSTATLGTPLAGTDGLQKTGSGTLALTVVSGYTGNTVVNGGTLELAGAAGGTSLIRGAVTVNAGAALTLTGGDGTGFGWSNTISNLNVSGGTVNASGGAHIGFGSYVAVAMANGGTTAGNWQWNGDGLLGFSSSGDSTNTISGSLVLRADGGANHTFSVADGAANVDLQLNATLADQWPEVSWVSASSLVKTGAGTLVLAGANSYDGQTDIQSGMLTAAHSTAIGAGGWNGATMTWIRDGATLALQGGVSLDEHFHVWGSGSGGRGAVRSINGNNALTMTYGGSGSGPGFCLRSHTTVGVDADTLSVTGFYQDGGAFGLTKVGAGILKLTSSSAYTGGTVVSAGKLLVDTAGTISTGNLTINDGATCEIRNPTAAMADTADIHLSGTGALILATGVTLTVDGLYVDGVKQAPGLYTAGSLAGNLSGGGSLNVLGGPIDLTAPVTRQVVQRNGSGTGSIVISGSYSNNPDRLEARAVVMAGAGNNGTSTAWTTIVPAPAGGTFSGTLTGVAAGGWYQIEVRSVIGGVPTTFSAIIQRVGVGDVYLTAGHSNSANHGEPGTNTDDRVSAKDFSNGAWTMAADPMPGASGTLGSVWTRLGTMLTSATNVPVGFVCVGVGGTPVSYWVPPSTEGYLRLKAAAQAFPANGFRAVLWHQGESDSHYSTSAASYQSMLASAIAQLRSDAGWTMPWYVAEASDLSNTTLSQEEPVIAGQRRVIFADPLVFAGPQTDDFHLEGKLYDGVHFNNAGMADHAQQWAQALAGTAPLAPKNGNIESNTALADGGIAVVGMTDTSSPSVLGWRILNASGDGVADGGNGYFNPDTTFYGAAAADTSGSGGVLPNMNGRHVSFFYSGAAGNHFLQTRRATLLPDTTYTLTVALGVRGNGGIYGNARIELLADGIAVATRDVTLADLNAQNGGNAVNTFTDMQLTHATGATVTAGQALAIRISKVNGGDSTYVDFDNVRLTSADNGPEPTDYDSWKSANNVAGGPDDDDDNDGLDNRFEYAFGLDPRVSSGNPVDFLTTATGTNLTYTRRKQSLTGLDYSVWTSTDLNEWTEDTGAMQTATAVPGTSNESVDVSLSPGMMSGERLFIRIHAR